MEKQDDRYYCRHKESCSALAAVSQRQVEAQLAQQSQQMALFRQGQEQEREVSLSPEEKLWAMFAHRNADLEGCTQRYRDGKIRFCCRRPEHEGEIYAWCTINKCWTREFLPDNST